MFEFPKSTHNQIIYPTSIENIITAVQSNEKEINKDAVMHVFEEILKTTISDAKASIKQDMDFILKELGCDS